MATYKDPRTGITTTQTHVTRPGWRPPKAPVKEPVPTFSAGGFRGRAGQEMIRSQEARYGRERREAADAKGLQAQRTTGELARSNLVGQQAMQRQKSQQRVTAKAARGSQAFQAGQATQKRAWQVEDRNLLAKGQLAEARAKGRPGAMSDQELFEARQDLSMQYNAKESKDLRKKFKTEEKFIKSQLDFMNQPSSAGQDEVISMTKGQDGTYTAQPELDPAIASRMAGGAGEGMWKTGTGAYTNIGEPPAVSRPQEYTSPGFPVGMPRATGIITPTVAPTAPSPGFQGRTIQRDPASEAVQKYITNPLKKYNIFRSGYTGPRGTTS